MAVPYRLFYRLHLLQCRGHDTNNTFDQAYEWEDAHREESRLLWRFNAINPDPNVNQDRWYVLYRGYEEDGWGQDGADAVMDVDSTVEYLAPYLNLMNGSGFSSFYDQCGVYYDDKWDEDHATARRYDGVNDFPFFPHRYHSYSYFNVAGHTISAGDIPAVRHIIHEAWCNYVDQALALAESQNILEKGMILGITSFTPTQGDWDAGDGLGIDINIKNVKLRYFNPCCNSFSRYSGPSTGGFPLVLTGLGFANDDDEINSKSGVANAHAWGDTIYRIYIEKPDGTIVSTLRPFPWSEFSVDSNSQVTIPSFPALNPGLYQVRFQKQNTGVNIYSHAGDWRTDPDGRMTPGERLYIWIYDTIEPPRIPIVRTKWTWKKGDLIIFKYYAPIDVRTPLIFYEGLILGISDYTRGVNDETGLPLFPDVEITLDNTSQEFSKLLSQYWVKNQIIELWFGYQEEPDIFKETVFRGVVTDYEKPGSTWTVKAHDIMEKYFALKIPKFLVTETDYPNVHPNHLGKEMPEILGRVSLTIGTAPGAVEAIYVDTTKYKYLAARGSVLEIDEVYVDGALKALTTDYSISYEDGGKTYITFISDQGDAKVTFNCRGYSYADWDDPESDGGYIMNPAYIILFCLAFFAEVPDIFVDIPAFDSLADYYEENGYGRSGYLILQSQKDLPAILQELLFTYGAKLWTTTDGKITIGRKDIGDFDTDLIYYEQIHALEEPSRPMGLDKTVNYANVRWEHYPSLNQSMRAKIVSRPSSIADFEAEMMPGRDWDFLWTTDEALVDMRTTEDLLRFGYGDQRLGLTIGLEHIYDLDILDNFRFQDPFGLNPLGEGEAGRYFYTERLTYGLLSGRMLINGIDLQWALRQACILGDDNLQADNWSSASEYDRTFCYLCDEVTGMFADGEPGKVLMSE